MNKEDKYTKNPDFLRQSFRVGQWRSKIVDGVQVGLYADNMMDMLLGTDPSMTPEERLAFYHEHIYPEDIEIVAEYGEKLQQKLTEVEYRYYHPTLGLRTVRCYGKTTIEDGIPVVHGMHQDITDNIRLNYKSELHDRTLSQLTQKLYAFNLTVDLLTGKYSLIKGTGMDKVVALHDQSDDYNEVQLKLCLTVDPKYRKQFFDLVSLEELRRKAVKKGVIGSLEFPVYYEETGEHFWHELTVFSESDENGMRVVNVLGRDVTAAHEKAETEAQLVIAKAANKAKTNFLFNMSHDIRTPMNAIIGFTNLLEKHLDEKDLAREYISKIQTSNGILLELINNVLEMARIESGKASLEEEVIETRLFGESLFSIFEAQMKSKDIEVEFSMDITHENIMADPTKLREIYLNILSNAMKYTPAGGKVSFKANELPSDTPGEAIYQTVIQDTGIGMSPEFLPHLFEEFTRERNTTESKVSGTGLGMAIVKKLIELMNGHIEVESELGKGTTFTITIPHRIAPDTPKEQQEQTNEEGTSSFEGRRILLAEDNELNAEIAITLLKEVGFEVDHAMDGLICLQKMQEAEAGYYDVILMDIQMPNMNGYKATELIRNLSDERKCNIPILAMTANAFDEDKKNAINIGMNGHLSKPIDLAELLTTLQRIMK